MENIRIAVLNTYDKVCTFLDNKAPDALHFYDDELHQYLKGTANTYSFKVSSKHSDAVYLTEGNKLAFRYQNQDFYLNIMHVTCDEYEMEVEAYSLNFELLNEMKEAYKASTTMTFQQYLNLFDYEKIVVLGINEVSDKSIVYEWTEPETMLARMFSLASAFDAEAELLPVLNNDYSLKHIVLNVYRKNTDTIQGIGIKRTDIVLRYGKNVKGITKKSNIIDLYTSIKPIGKNELTIAALNKTENDVNGKIEYQSPGGSPYIMAVQARDRFPSNLMAKANERYIMKTQYYDTDNINILYKEALVQLKENCVPQVEYEAEGYFNTGIGDTVTIVDEAYTPNLYLRARVVEQQRSFTDPSNNKTTFSNYKELQSQIDPVLIQKMNKMIFANKAYTCSILTDNGVVFKNGKGTTTLTASIMDTGKDMTDSFIIHWYKDGVEIATGESITVFAREIDEKTVYMFEAFDQARKIRGTCEVTVTNLVDGRTSYTHIAYANSADGTRDFSVSDSNRAYVGMYVDFIEANSSNPQMYVWSKIKGADGSQGIQGPKGTDGKTSYLHIAYANSADGKTGFSITDGTDRLFIGQYTDHSSVDSTDASKYSWTKIKGEPGSQGLQGPKGTDGKTCYTWIKYADSPTSGMSDSPTGKKYIGLAYNKETNNKSSNYKDYTWSLIKGDKGDQGVQGEKGIDGKTYYTWIKYAIDALGTNMSDSPAGKNYIGLAYNKDTATESTNASDYTWSLIKGDKGDKGDTGDKGEPTGIVQSPTEPISKYTGMLWKHTGMVSGLVKDATYRWNGLEWELYFFSTVNIKVDSLSAISANLGNVTAGSISIPWVVPRGGQRKYVGKTEMSKSQGGQNPLTFIWDVVATNTTTGVETVVSKGNYAKFDYNGVSLYDGNRTYEINADFVNEVERKAPSNHASTGTSYGVGTTSNYGHVKVLNSLASSYINGQAMSPYQGYLINQKVTAITSGVVATGRVTVKATSNNWLNIVGVPGYNSSVKYFAIVNCEFPLTVYVRSDGRLIGYGPLIQNGVSYLVDYKIIKA